MKISVIVKISRENIRANSEKNKLNDNFIENMNTDIRLFREIIR